MIGTSPSPPRSRGGHRDDGTIAAVVIGLAGDLAAASASWITGRGFRWTPLRSLPQAAAAWTARMAAAGSSPVRDLRASTGPPGWLVLASFLAIVGAGVAVTVLVRRARARPAGRPEPESARWATRRTIAPLIVRRRCAGRLVVGQVGRSLVATEARHSLLVIGPTQSGKTSGLVIPALLEWDGPVVATSVKRDLLDVAIGRRRELGEVSVYDPTGTTGVPSTPWSPLDAARSWQGATRVAGNLCGAARAGGGNLEDGAFWYAMAEKLLAPLLFAAANGGHSLADVVRWVDLRLTEEPLAVLGALGVAPAWQAAMASFDREERQLSSVYATLESVLGAFADPGVLAASGSGGIDPRRLTSGGASTIFLLAPSRTQERLAPVFVALLGEILEAAFERHDADGASASGLLVVLDEAANIAPVRDLDVLASTAAGHGVQLVTVFQDYAQIEARYGARAATVVNNHRARLLCSGVADTKTLGEMSTLLGESEQQTRSSSEADGQVTTTWSPMRQPLATADALRRIKPGEAVLLYGHLPPARLALRPWFGAAALRRLAARR